MGAERGPRRALWPDDRVERLKTLWTDGLSATEIAMDLGGGMTRNAVLGMVHRQKLTPRKSPVPKVAHSGGPTPKKPRRTHGWIPQPPRPKKVVIPKPEPPPEPTGFNVTLMQLEHHHCRWIIGDPVGPATVYCGAAKDGESPYCAHHRAKATA